jgi:hypothetical protein
MHTEENVINSFVNKIDLSTQTRKKIACIALFLQRGEQ